MELLNSPQRADFFRGSCIASENIGSLVYISGPKVGGLVPVRVVDPEDEAKMPSAGLIIHKFSQTECMVQQSGPVNGVFTGLEEGKTYKAGTAGVLRRLAPVAPPGGYAMVQFVGHAVAGDVFHLSPEMRLAKRLP